MMSWQSLLIGLPLVLASGMVQAGERAACLRSSPAHTVALVELYTSEGCSSCPPADRWLGTLRSRYSPDHVLPLALHVNYWDYIGWRDPYAQEQFTARQRELGRLAGSSTIYTPGVFLGMRSLRHWNRDHSVDSLVQETNRRPARARISLDVAAADAGTATVVTRIDMISGERWPAGLQAVLVVVEDGLISSVAQGENRGSVLRHDHVVRHWLPLALAGSDETRSAQVKLPLKPEWQRKKLGLAVFVQDTQHGEILQALALPDCLGSKG